MIINLKLKITNLKLIRGQALVILLVFVATATIITSAAVTVTIINARSTGILAQGIEALAVAEAGAEEAILRILRDPLNNYAGATIPVGNGTATIVVAGTTTKTITSTGTIGTFTRKIQVQGTFSDDKFTLSSWQEIN